MTPDVSPENLAEQMAMDMEIKKRWQNMEEMARAKYEAGLCICLVLLISGILVVDIILSFSLSDPIIAKFDAMLEWLAWWHTWVNS